MNSDLRERLIQSAREHTSAQDPAHDFEHTRRVLAVAERIAREEGADLDVVVAAALFHDLVNYPKNDPRSAQSADESAELAGQLLMALDGYSSDHIERVQAAIRAHSFSSGRAAASLEARIIQDADRLESTGAIAIMRTCASSGSMGRSFYHPADPFAEDRQPDASRFAIDLFFTRLLRVKDGMHTETAKAMAARRTAFLEAFLAELSLELEEVYGERDTQ